MIDFVDHYAALVDAPLQEETTVTALRPRDDGYEIVTDRGTWSAETVMLASGACNIPSVPEASEAIPPGIDQITPHSYRNPDELRDGGVLVVGASATGLQLAEENPPGGSPGHAVGGRTRPAAPHLPGEGHPVLDGCGTGRSDERWDEIEDLGRARNLPSPQLVGTPDRRTMDLNGLTDAGIRLRGRLGAVRDSEVLFSGGLRNQCSLARSEDAEASSAGRRLDRRARR